MNEGKKNLRKSESNSGLILKWTYLWFYWFEKDEILNLDSEENCQKNAKVSKKKLLDNAIIETGSNATLIFFFDKKSVFFLNFRKKIEKTDQSVYMKSTFQLFPWTF